MFYSGWLAGWLDWLAACWVAGGWLAAVLVAAAIRCQTAARDSGAAFRGSQSQL